MRRIREPWKRGPRIERLSSVIAPQYNPQGSPDLDTERGVEPQHAPRAHSGSHPKRPMEHHDQRGYLSRREGTAVSAARATPAMGLEVQEVGPIETPRHEDTVYWPATMVPSTVVDLRPKRAETVARAQFPDRDLTRAVTNQCR